MNGLRIAITNEHESPVALWYHEGEGGQRAILLMQGESFHALHTTKDKVTLSTVELFHPPQPTEEQKA